MFAHFVRREHRHRKVAINLHELKGNKTVEPCVCDLIHDLFIPFLRNPLDKLFSLLLDSFIGNPPVDNNGILKHPIHIPDAARENAIMISSFLSLL
uniref:Uncharacterized protein n=1 Tax=Candidatus Methanogaster sp. ANME-2c ERB4 TaxID=2759911 RepID=A0A7G9Y5G0_9EURY|nr:hypothetical protein CPEMFCDE_00003 [Methanosarcinales archaeon ANME-2c ERB4]QNO45449.1 hypothetical protein HCBNPDKA_00003 [Methanosarcinales archaeon ANME-2c ERB4]